MKNNSKNVLLIFIKNPEKGNVKTRLAESIGEEKALNVYHKLLQVTYEATCSLECRRQVWYSSYIDNDDIWPSDEYDKQLQNGKDLGERMKNAFKQSFSNGYEKAVIIGSDCAEMTEQIIEQAFEHLDENEVVVGPSQDGGYYLLGMRDFYPALFEDVNWSTSSVFKQTVKRIENLKLSMQLLPMLNDIDTIEDLSQSDITTDLS